LNVTGVLLTIFDSRTNLAEQVTEEAELFLTIKFTKQKYLKL
jgi:hypothetical protein